MSKTTERLVKDWESHGLNFNDACDLINRLIAERKDKKITWRERLVLIAKASAFCLFLGWIMSLGSTIGYKMTGTPRVVSKSVIEVIYKFDDNGEMIELSREEVDPNAIKSSGKEIDPYSEDFVWPEDEPDNKVFR